MSNDHVVNSVTDATQLAHKLKADGALTWFRGQAQADWPLLSSLGRKQSDAEATSAIQGRIADFCAWLQDTPELSYLLEQEHVHALFAVLQHFGVPTHYVDFTTEPDIAGFFAAHDPAALPGTQGCIIGIDPDDFVENLRVVAEVRQWDRDVWPEKVNVTVEQLWRMQAQSGSFVYLPVAGVERLCGYDRILFSHDGTPYPIVEERIYPKRKSPLESRLDEFFTEELMRNNQLYHQALVEEWRRDGIRVEWWNLDDPDETAYLALGTKPHASWSCVGAGWLASAGGGFWDATSEAPEPRLSVTADAGRAEIERGVRLEVTRVLESSRGCRAKAVRWRVDADHETLNEWEACLNRVWDGMRGLPYTDEH